ncbi:pentatricopeptide repeat-containing protein At5g16860-like [Tasmannia lanceolata]|uniref:pentatricopeptide repeat-containing protein At5g16860-like n=1 Tax=Tasmannia lanceolata TaxID=3420 RepID=UPI004064ABE6
MLLYYRTPLISALKKTNNTLTSHSFASLLKQCKSLSEAQRIHQQILTTGLLQSPTQSSSLATSIISTYLHFGASSDALSALEKLSPSSVYWWNNLIQYHVLHGHLNHGISLYYRMQILGTKPDHYTFPFVLKACGELPSFRRGTAVHTVVTRGGFESNVFVCNALVAMYARCGAIEDARQVFDEITERRIDDVVSWNSMVAAYAQSGNYRGALETFVGMMEREDAKRPEVVSLVNILPACASLGASSQGKQIHCFAVRNGLLWDIFVGNAMVDMYAKCGMMREALRVFEGMKRKDVVSWNAMVTGYSQSGSFGKALELFEKMREERIELNVVTWSAVIAGYAQRGHGDKALDVFRQMQLARSEPNAVTLVSLLSACASVGGLLQGKETHCHVLRCHVNWANYEDGDDLMVKNGIIDMYSKCKSFDAARALFDSIPLIERNVVTWTVMIGGHAQHGDANHALKLFSQMLLGTNAKPNAFTISCVLMACGRLAALRFGRQIHAYVTRNQYEGVMSFVSNCLIDMYSKSGDIDAARNVFDKMSQRNAVSWTSLMTGYGMHGHGDDALRRFNEMQEAGLVPDGVTFLVVLYACSHSGMVDHGLNYFTSMSRDFGVAAGVEHYACMVDILGRAGRLDEARELIEGMPMEPSAVVWVALLSACRIHANVELGEYAAQRLLQLESENDGSYTLLSNIYANAGRWRDVARIRSLMKKAGIKKRPGCSWVQGKKGTASFFVGDRSHPQSQQIYAVLATLMQRIKAMGYVPETSFALHDVDDEEKGSLLVEHSEKLALAYGILTSSPGLPIRITKNLRVCGDCHSAITFISKIIDHEIIVRDPSRFHHFKNGSCSCGGYW